MKVTFDSNEPIERVLAVVSSLYDVDITIKPSEDAAQAQMQGEDGGGRTVKTRHFA